MAKAKTSGKALSAKSQHTPADSDQSTKRIVLDEKKVDKLLSVAKGKARTKSVSTPFALYVIQCTATTERGWNAESLNEHFNKLVAIDSSVAMAFDLQFAGGCRISEVLAIKWSDIDDFGKVTVHSQKGGVTRVVSPTFSAQLLKKHRDLKSNPFMHLNRFYVYRIYKRLGISEVYGENKRASVTHLPRHEVALASKKAERQNTVTQSQLGQKSVKSTEHYLKQKGGNKK